MFAPHFLCPRIFFCSSPKVSSFFVLYLVFVFLFSLLDFPLPDYSVLLALLPVACILISGPQLMLSKLLFLKLMSGLHSGHHVFVSQSKSNDELFSPYNAKYVHVQ